MQQRIFEVKRDRFDLLDKNLYIIQGDFPIEYEAEAYLGQMKLDSVKEFWENNSSQDRFKDNQESERITVKIHLPEDLSSAKNLTVYAVSPNGRRIRWFVISSRDLEARRNKPYYYIEEEKVDFSDHSIQIRGWVVFSEPVKLYICNDKGEKILSNIQWTNRVDVAAQYQETQIDSKCGFFIELQNVKSNCINLVFQSDVAEAVYPVYFQRFMVGKRKIDKYIQKGKRYFQSHGVKGLILKSIRKIKSIRNKPVVYQKWIQKHLPSEMQLQTQREMARAFKMHPKISIIVPLYNTPEIFLRKMIFSCQAQTYENWELCLSDGSGKNSSIRKLLEHLAAEDTRINVVYHDTSLRIAENTNAAIGLSTGDYIAFMDHDDELTPNALFECVKKLNQDPEIKVFYSDEDKMSNDGHKFFQPHFKPDFNIDLLCSVNYICHLFVIKREILENVGLIRKEFEGAQDYDFILRCVETVSPQLICHIPKILYHWRSHEGSTSENPDSKAYAFEAGQRAVESHYKRVGIKAIVEKGEYLGLYRTKFVLDEKPLISIIIPNKDHIDDLKRCIDSIEIKSTYKNYEYIIVENNSVNEETFEFYKVLEKENSKVKVVYWQGIFNYSAINNYGVKYAKGEYILLLNNDTEIINEDCLEELLGYCTRNDVGAVGARLYYEDDTIQHAGVVIGFGGIAGHCFVMQPRGYSGYCHRIICAQDYSAVTAACMMIKKKAFYEVDGLSEELMVAFNDVDFCMKLRRAGYLIVYNPYAELYHYESKSRGLEDTPEKVARFNREIAIFEKKWPEILKNGDPFYNPNLTLESQNFSLKRI